MLSFVPIYPETCRPDDVMLAQEQMRKRYLFGDVYVHGEYPRYLLKWWERDGIDIARSRATSTPSRTASSTTSP